MASWYTLGTQAMEEAQGRVGLSDERVAREIPVSTRTWIRWKKRGQVPVQWLPNVAKVLDLEVEQSERVKVSLDGNGATPAGDDAHLARIEELLEGVLVEIRALRDDGESVEAQRARR